MLSVDTTPARLELIFLSVLWPNKQNKNISLKIAQYYN